MAWLVSAAAGEALRRLDAWLESTRGPSGYGGPVAHWWQQCLRFTGSAADWRYEGLVLGYLRLWQRTGADVWLERACRAADDVLAYALPSGGFRNSSFELNPAPFGTPHEAACDVALLRLALALRAAGQRVDRAAAYAAAAARNLWQVYAGVLWDDAAGGFLDVPGTSGFVPNKQATAAEAWLALAEWEGNPTCAERFALPPLRLIRQAQVRTGDLAGAIDQIVTRRRDGWQRSGRSFPLYVARCLPALVTGAERFGDRELAEAANAAARFVSRTVGPNGECPLIVYASGAVRTYPAWTAGLGDVLRGLAAAQAVGGPPPPHTALDCMLAGQDVSGGIQTARGFATILNESSADGLPEFRDLLHVVGWNDKALRYLADVVDPSTRPQSPASYLLDVPSIFRGHRLRFRESPSELWVEEAGRRVYHWRKGREAAWIGAPWFAVR